MPNLEGIGLQNFRTFRTKESIEFAPITLITGTNNAGKSSIFKAIQFLVHNFKDGNISDTLDFKTMKHELGNLERIYNRVSMAKFKNSEIPQNQSVNSQNSDFQGENSDIGKFPIFDENEYLVFIFPIKFGGSRDIDATLEVRYELKQYVQDIGERKEVAIYHDIKSLAVVKDGEHLHRSNVIGLMNNYDEAPLWEMETSIDLKKIIQLIIDTPFVDIKKEIKPDERTDDYFSLNLFSRIEKYKHAYFDIPFFKKNIDGYEGFTEKFEKGRSLFSDYSDLTEDEKSKLSAIEQKITTDLLQGSNNSQYNILDCFKTNNIIGFMGDGMDEYIVNAEFKENEEIQENSEDQISRFFFKNSFQTTPNSQLFTNLLRAIESDFTDTVQKNIDSLNKVYFLPTTRGRNREWFIDEQNSEDIQIVREFSAIYLKSHPQIENFVNFWIGVGEINELDDNGKKKQKGFKIGKELSVFRDEAIGLTKIFLVNFDGTKTPLVDLGYGVSQLLPIIMKIAIIAYKHQLPYEYDIDHQYGSHRETIYFRPSTLLIEEPEANLHPSLQSKMAELFIDAASRFNIQFLIETHSEYLIYKFQEYIGQKKVSPTDVKMYYINHPNDVIEGVKDEYISHVKIGKDGSIDYDKYFGKGFFDEQTNLKLSLFNIQRKSFVDEYNSIKEKLTKSKEALKDYDTKIDKLNHELSTTMIGKSELEEQLIELKREKEEKELELERQIIRQTDIIDEYTAKTDYLKYLTEIEAIIDKSKIDNTKTLQYLATGKYLLKNLDNDADFAPVIIQYGRAVEFEMIKWVNDFKSTVSITDIDNWCSDTGYTNRIRQVFIDLGIALDSSNTNYLIEPDKKLNLFELKSYIKSNPNRAFGKLTQIFELFYYISPDRNVTYNYSSVPLMVAFSNYLKSIWTDYDTAEGLFNTCRSILDLRNCAGHTYNNNACIGDIIDKSTAQDYVNKVEAIFKCL